MLELLRKSGVVTITKTSKTITEHCLHTEDVHPFKDYEHYPLTLQEAREIFEAIPVERNSLRLKFLVFLSQKNRIFPKQKANVQWMAAKFREIKREKKKHRETSFSLMLLSVERILGEDCLF